MWVIHLDSVKKRRQAGTRICKAVATRKQKSARQKSSDKVATAGNEYCTAPQMIPTPEMIPKLDRK